MRVVLEIETPRVPTTVVERNNIEHDSFLVCDRVAQWRELRAQERVRHADMVADLYYQFASESVRAKPYMKLDVIPDVTDRYLGNALPGNF